MGKIIQLPQHIINQIAAGEVVEGPHSVVKELIENSIDAGATHITISLVKGGIQEIKIDDNGSGIEKDDISILFSPHTTSKIKEIEDLKDILTLGFRGEALSSIASVSEVNITSMVQTIGPPAYSIFHKSNQIGKLTPTNRTGGTTIIVRNLFRDIPARAKFVSSEQTNLRKCVHEVHRHALINPTIRFTINHNGKNLADYLAVDVGNSDIKQIIHPSRVEQVLGEKYKDNLLSVFYKENSFTIGGYIGHPRVAKDRTADAYLFINNRPVWDKGIVRAIYSGMNRFIPQESKLPFVIMIKIDPSQVDINVHPRKEEIRLANPFRTYSSVTFAIKKTIEENTKEDIIYTGNDFTEKSENIDYATHRLRENETPSYNKGSSYNTPKTNFSSTGGSTKQALYFSQNLLTSPTADENSHNIFAFKKAIQYLNRYIILEKNSELWIVDQHAAAERIRFEELLNDYESDGIDKVSQNILVPVVLLLNLDEKLKLEELMPLLVKLGFSISITEQDSLHKAQIKAIPQQLVNGNIEQLLRSLISYADSPQELENTIKTAYEDIIATISCHNSLRANQEITSNEANELINKLMKCKNPYSCPHGRPIIWKLTTQEIDDNFNRG